jgi:hypothetical protein
MTMKYIPIIALGLFFSAVADPKAEAAGMSREACRAEIASKRPCRGNRLASPGLTACFRAAMGRCLKGGPGAI